MRQTYHHHSSQAWWTSRQSWAGLPCSGWGVWWFAASSRSPDAHLCSSRRCETNISAPLLFNYFHVECVKKKLLGMNFSHFHRWAPNNCGLALKPLTFHQWIWPPLNHERLQSLPIGGSWATNHRAFISVAELVGVRLVSFLVVLLVEDGEGQLTKLKTTMNLTTAHVPIIMCSPINLTDINSMDFRYKRWEDLIFQKVCHLKNQST